MKLRAKCPCGATFEAEDLDGSYINQGGKPDEQGRKFIIQLQFDKWYEAHKSHQRKERCDSCGPKAISGIEYTSPQLT